jgi:phosphoribosylformimino-5-aminoimidazole carboxamide ribotide isomerase
LIVTDVGRDGTKTGINIGFTAAIANAVSIPVIASGGLAGIGDISSLKAERGTPIAGAILGRALYDGLIDPVQALSTAL